VRRRRFVNVRRAAGGEEFVELVDVEVEVVS
jgi:hypothetical protein